MSIDIAAYSEICEDIYSSCGYDTRNNIVDFALSTRLNDYWGTRDLFLNNYDEKMDNSAGHDILLFSRGKILELKKIDTEKNFGKDLTDFLDELLKTNLGKYYIKIIE